MRREGPTSRWLLSKPAESSDRPLLKFVQQQGEGRRRRLSLARGISMINEEAHPAILRKAPMSAMGRLRLVCLGRDGDSGYSRVAITSRDHKPLAAHF